jgi:hypothetical protein
VFTWPIFLPASQVQTIQIHPSVGFAFGDQIRFVAQVEAPSPIQLASVFYRVSGSSSTKTVTAIVEPGSPTTARAVVDTHAAPIPPFTPVTFWWQVQTQDGLSATTSPQNFVYADNRFAWQSTAAPGLTIYWVDGGPAFGQAVLDLAQHDFQRIALDLSFEPPGATQIYVYPRLEDLQSSMELGGRTWTGGHTEPTLGTVLLAAAPTSEGQLQLENELPHELTHSFLIRRMDDGYANLPAWLAEGLASQEEAVPPVERRLALEAAVRDGKLLPLSTLCTSFPSTGAEAVLAYAQSASVVQYIRNVYGQGAFPRLFDAYQEGTDCAGGLQRVLRRSIGQLESEWLANTASLGPGLPAGAWLFLGLPGLLALLAGVMPLAQGRPPATIQDGGTPKSNQVQD